MFAVQGLLPVLAVVAAKPATVGLAASQLAMPLSITI